MSALPLSAVSPLVPLSVAQASRPKAAHECLDCFQSLHGLKPAVGSSHAGEIKYNAKFFQVHDICFPGILSLLSSLKANSWKWNWCTEKEFPGGLCCGMAVAVLKLSCCWLLGTGDIRVLPSRQWSLCRRRCLLSKWPMLFPTLAWWFTCFYSLTLIFFSLQCPVWIWSFIFYGIFPDVG